MADAVAVGHRLDGGGRQHGGNRPPLVEDHTQQPAEGERGARTPDEPGAGGLGKVKGRTRPGPEPDQPAQAPQVDQQDLGEARGPQRREQEARDQIQVFQYAQSIGTTPPGKARRVISF